MNNARRKEIKSVVIAIDDIKRRIEDILNDEQCYYDNIPENLLSSERAGDSEDAISIIEEAIENIENVIDNLEEIA